MWASLEAVCAAAAAAVCAGSATVVRRRATTTVATLATLAAAATAAACATAATGCTDGLSERQRLLPPVGCGWAARRGRGRSRATRSTDTAGLLCRLAGTGAAQRCGQLRAARRAMLEAGTNVLVLRNAVRAELAAASCARHAAVHVHRLNGHRRTLPCSGHRCGRDWTRAALAAARATAGACATAATAATA